MITAEGPKLIEYNVRFGDPECQVLMLRLMSDLVPALIAARDGQLKNFDLRWYDERRARRRDGDQRLSGQLRQGLGDRRARRAPAALPGVEIFHAGTKARGRPHHGQWRTRAQRLRHSARRSAQAQQRAYAAVDRIDWPDGFCRRDIGYLAVARENVPST